MYKCIKVREIWECPLLLAKRPGSVQWIGQNSLRETSKRTTSGLFRPFGLQRKKKKTLSSKTKKTNNTLTHLTSSRLAIIITVQIIRSKEENKILPFTQASEADKDPNSCVQCLPPFNRSQSWASYCCYTSGPTSPTTLNTSNCIFFLFSADPGNRSEAKRSPVGSSWCESRPSFSSAH